MEQEKAIVCLSCNPGGCWHPQGGLLPEHQGSFQMATLAFKPYIPLIIVHSCISESYQQQESLSTAEELYIAQ